MNTNPNIPEIRTHERENLIRELTKQLEQDVRISTAWLSGSIARGDDDWLSDVDLFVAVSDDSIEEIVRARHKFAAQAIAPILSMDHMRNAPPRGAYLLAHYPGEYGPQHVDWFWQPESLTSLPDNGRILFDKTGLTTVDSRVWEQQMHQEGSRPPIDSTDPIDLINNKVEFFWSMALIVAKYIVRNDEETVGHMTKLISRTLDEISGSLAANRDTDYTGVPLEDSDSLAQFRVLRNVTHRAKSLNDQLKDRGAIVPEEAISQIEQFIDVCEKAALG
jgi:hypothetical protein